MSCLMCDNLERGKTDSKCRVWCKVKKEYVKMIDPKCKNFVHMFGSEVKNG